MKNEIQQLRDIWYLRNPVNDGSGRFFKTVLMVFDDFVTEQLKNTLTLESKIGENGEEIKPHQTDSKYSTTRSSEEWFDAKLYQADLEKYNQAPTIKQMPSIIKKLEKDLEWRKSNYDSTLKRKKAQIDLKNKTIREQKEEIDRLKEITKNVILPIDVNDIFTAPKLISPEDYKTLIDIDALPHSTKEGRELSDEELKAQIPHQFQPSLSTTSLTICMYCGKEKFLH